MQVKEMKVYVTAIWWTDCDPLLRIIGNDADTVRKAAEEAMSQEARDCITGDADHEYTFEEAYQQIHWNGIGSMNLKDVIAAYEIPSLEPDYTNLLSGDKDALLYITD